MTRALGVVGASGRLGSATCALATDEGWRLTLLADSNGWKTETVPDVLVDVSHATVLASVVTWCQEMQVPLVAAVSGLSTRDEGALRALAATVGVVRAQNLSFGHFLQTRVLQYLAQIVPASLDVEVSVLERHPTSKDDRLSASATALADTWRTARGGDVADIASTRGGLPVADHDVRLTFADEQLLISHSVRHRRVAARGALMAAEWLRGSGPGLWTMADVYARSGRSVVRALGSENLATTGNGG